MIDDRVLVRRCQQRDPTAVRELLERFQTDVYGLCVRILNHRQDAEDVCQEVFLRIFRSLHRWDAARPLRPWVIGITVNRCRTWLAQRKKRPELADYLHDTAEGRLPDDSGEMVREIAAAVEELRPMYRAVFAMFHDQGLPYEEISEALDRPVGTIKTWLHRARLQILQRLQERGMVSDSFANEETPKPAQ